jgi:hypothetical protein
LTGNNSSNLPSGERLFLWLTSKQKSSRQNALGTEQLLGSGQPGDAHYTLVVAPSGCGKTELLKRILLKFWHSFNNISLLSPSLGPSIGIAPEDGDWLLLK